MFSVKNFITDIAQVPAKWVFEKYLNLSEPLQGQKVTINSIFNNEDKTPSMVLYFSEEHGEYRFKDFSSGNFGEALNVVAHLYNLSYAESCDKIKADYITYLKEGNVHIEPTKITNALSKAKTTWSVENVNYRVYNTRDVEFWSPFNIGKTLLDFYNVKPIATYTMKETDFSGKVVKEFEVKALHLYGYHNSKGDLYKIYQPKSKRKFIKVKDHIQGSDKVRGHKTLIIASSLKDCMSIKSLGLTVDVIAPDSENSFLSKEQVNILKQKYKNIVTLLDSDQAGIKAMTHYKDVFDFPFIYIPLEKDISDVIKYHGKQRALQELIPKLNNALESKLVK